jgi:antitoxin (DNA-binding transcriptional repressor) of toxin-antitoxin stability system
MRSGTLRPLVYTLDAPVIGVPELRHVSIASGDEMNVSGPATKFVTLDEARQQLDQLVDEVAAGNIHVTIERDGEALARLEPAVSPKQREIDAMLKDPRFRELASLGLALKDVPLDELEREVARAIREARESHWSAIGVF